MARPRGSGLGRTVVIAARFSENEASDIDKIRGSLSRSEWLRWLVLKARKEQGS